MANQFDEIRNEINREVREKAGRTEGFIKRNWRKLAIGAGVVLAAAFLANLFKGCTTLF